MQKPYLAIMLPLGATLSQVMEAVQAHFAADNPATGAPVTAVDAAQAFATPQVATAGGPGSVATQTPGSTPAAAANNTTSVDSRGLPWDARIHANPPTMTEKDKIWRKKRGVADATVAEVEQQLRAALAANGAAAHAGPADAGTPNPQQQAAQAWGVVPAGCPIAPEKWAMIEANQTVSLSPVESEWLKNYSAQTMQQSAAAQAAFQPGIPAPHANPAAQAFAATTLPPATPAQAMTDPAAAFGFTAPAVPAAPKCPHHSFEALRDFILANANSPANPQGKLTVQAVTQAMATLQVPGGNLGLLVNMPNVWQAAANAVDGLMAA